jgi:hypothetical protein
MPGRSAEFSTTSQPNRNPLESSPDVPTSDSTTEFDLNSAGRLPAESIKRAILHPESRIREMAVNYFSDSYTDDESLMPWVIRALDQHGKEDAFMLVGASVNLPQTAETIDWVIRELNDPQSVSYDSYTYNLERVLCAAHPALLEPRGDEIARAEHLTHGAREMIAERIEFFHWDSARCWQELEDHCEQYREADYVRDANLGRAERIVEALARHGGSEERVLDLLAQPVDFRQHTMMKWMEPMSIQLAGRLRLGNAIPLLIDKMQLADDMLPHHCERALVRIGSDAVVQAVAEVFPGAAQRFRFAASAVLGDIRSDLAVPTALALLPAEEDPVVANRLCHALLGQFTYDAIEPVRKWLLERGFDDLEDRGLRNELLHRCAVLGRTFPEYEQWKEDYQAEERERLSVLEQAKDNPMVGVLYAMEQLTGQKTEDVLREIEEKKSARAVQEIIREDKEQQRGRVGRNDPCPCGSGKKYKKCCMRK